MSPNLLSKLSWPPRNFVGCYVYIEALCVCISEDGRGGGG
jgi:hypothetical protein